MQAFIYAAAAATAVGIDVGWQPTDDGGLEYIIQIEPHIVSRLKAGDVVDVGIRPELQHVRRYRIVIGDQPLPRVDRPGTAVADDDVPSMPAGQPHADASGMSVLVPLDDEGGTEATPRPSLAGDVPLNTPAGEPPALVFVPGRSTDDTASPKSGDDPPAGWTVASPPLDEPRTLDLDGVDGPATVDPPPAAAADSPQDDPRSVAAVGPPGPPADDTVPQRASDTLGPRYRNQNDAPTTGPPEAAVAVTAHQVASDAAGGSPAGAKSTSGKQQNEVLAQSSKTTSSEADAPVGQPADADPPRPWMALVAILLALFASLGGNAYLGWIAWDVRRRFRRLAQSTPNAGA